jgi:hypothetical protein
VGVDIGCGMMVVQTSLHANHLPDNLHGIREAIEKAVPVGRTDNGGPNDRGAWKDVPGHHLGEWAKLDRSQPHGSTYLGHALESLHESYDRLIVITDEQAHDTMPRPTNNAYMINVAGYRNGVGYGAWMHIEGWSESVIG